VRILYVEDDARDAELTRYEFRKSAPQYHLDIVSTQAEALACLNNPADPGYDLVLTDMRLPDGDGLAVLTSIRTRALPLAVVILTGAGDDETVVSALKAGADDYVVKRQDYLTSLPLVLEQALQRSRAEAARRAQPLRVLYAEHAAMDADLTCRHLARFAPYIHIEVVTTGTAVLQRLPDPGTNSAYDVLLLDYRLPSLTALEILKELRQVRGLDLPVVVTTGHGDEEVALQTLKLGATEYLVKTQEYLHHLPTVLESAFYRVQLAREQAALREEARVSAALARMGQELIASLNTRMMLDRLCRLTAEVLECDCTHTFLWEPKKNAYVPVAVWGDTPEQWEVVRVLEISQETVADLFARIERDGVGQATVATAQGLLPENLMRLLGVQLILCIPLRRGEQLLGVQCAGVRRRIDHFPPVQLRIARGISQIASLVIVNARLFEELEQANRLKSDFLATISHELRTPLQIVMGYASLLLDGDFGPLTEEQISALRPVDRNAQELFDLISATLDASRLQAGRLPVEITVVDLPQLIAELKEEMKDLASAKPELTVEWQVTVGSLRLYTDRTKLKVVLKNLLGNALKFTEHGGISVEVYLRDGGVEFCIADTGIGITPEVQPMIFEMFQQGDSSATRRYTGAGLGLYIVKRTLDLLEGTVTVESEVGKGSTFRVWMPVKAPAEQE
jgi:signal transduction histidine kinase/DNA-binding response OmpR family regulator